VFSYSFNIATTFTGLPSFERALVSDYFLCMQCNDNELFHINIIIGNKL